MSTKVIFERLGYTVTKEFNGVKAQPFTRFIVKNNEVCCMADNKNAIAWLQATGQV